MTHLRLIVIGLVIIALVFWAQGLLLLLPQVRIPYVNGFFVVIYLGLGLGLAITTHFGSNEPWDFTSLLEEDSK